ncbi:MAG: hypothetical protein KJ065_26865 [Anaerolineae bacterium]|nr:hypothetical protein [Anaerolineae bacterium]
MTDTFMYALLIILISLLIMLTWLDIRRTGQYLDELEEHFIREMRRTRELTQEVERLNKRYQVFRLETQSRMNKFEGWMAVERLIDDALESEGLS